MNDSGDISLPPPNLNWISPLLMVGCSVGTLREDHMEYFKSPTVDNITISKRYKLTNKQTNKQNPGKIM